MIVNTLFGVEDLVDVKVCNTCGETKHINDFGGRGHKKNGTYETKNTCKLCINFLKKHTSKLKKYVSKPDKDYCCPICERNEEQIKSIGGFQGLTYASKSIWRLDHDHETGNYRSYICDYCNVMLGRAQDNPEILEKGAEYLRSFK